MGLDSANVDPVDGMVIEHVGCGSIHMNMADGVRALGTVFQSIGFECQDHDLVSCATVVISTSPVLSQIVLINQSLSFCMKVLQICNNMDGWEHVSLECKASW